jgi:hypothetical protein
MARDHPDEFRLLSETPLEYIEEGFDTHVDAADGKPIRVDFRVSV